MAMARQKFLPLTNFQRGIIDRIVHDFGYSSEGVNKLYYRLRTELGTVPHPGMDDEGDVARTPDGGLYTPTKADFTSKYVFEYKDQEYTEDVVYQGAVAAASRSSAQR
jgi:hypothetical protein